MFCSSANIEINLSKYLVTTILIITCAMCVKNTRATNSDILLQKLYWMNNDVCLVNCQVYFITWLNTMVSRLMVDTVTSSRKAVSTREHLATGSQSKMERPRGIKMVALEQSTNAWWNSRPCDHLGKMKFTINLQSNCEWIFHLLLFCHKYD